MAGVIVEKLVDAKLSRHGYVVSTRRSRGTDFHSGHVHGGIELQLVHSGFVYSGIAGHGVEAREYGLSPGQALLIRSNVPHVTRPLDGTYYRSVLHFLPEILPSPQSGAIEAWLHDQGGARHVRILPNAMPRVLWVMRELERLMNQSPPASTSVVGHLLGLIVCDIHESPSAADHEDYGALCAAVVDFMKTNLRAAMSNSELSAKFYLSESRLRQVFRERVGCSPQSYWLRLKMEAARDCLMAGKSVKETAAEFGFDSISGFRRAFRRVTGLTPAQYQESCARSL